MAGESGHDEEAYRAALARHGVADVQPLYRQFLRRLKAQDGQLYEAAVARYETDVLGADRASDALQTWIDYGAWLAGSLAPGRLIAIDAAGRAEGASRPLPMGLLLLHLPDGTGERGLPVAVPEDPSDAQQAARKILCG